MRRPTAAGRIGSGRHGPARRPQPQERHMDDANMRKCAQDHAAAIERGDLAAATADFVAEMRAAVPELAKALPNPIEKAEVLSVDVGDDASVAQIRYTGTDGSA